MNFFCVCFRVSGDVFRCRLSHDHSCTSLHTGILPVPQITGIRTQTLFLSVHTHTQYPLYLHIFYAILAHCEPLCKCLSFQAYPMRSCPRGLALVLSNVRFDSANTDLDIRRGGEVDEETLRRLFTELDFTVSLHKDLTAEVS